MPKNGYIFFADSADRRVVHAGSASELRLDLPETASAADVAAAVAQAVSTLGGGRDLLIALASDDCLSATISTEGLPRRHRRDAMLFRFEEKLPLAAEEVMADFVDHTDTALAVASESVALRPLIAELRTRGLAVNAVLPAAFLLLEGPEKSVACDAMLVQSADRVDLFFFQDQHPVEWLTLPASIRDLEPILATRRITLGHPLVITTRGLDAALFAQVNGLFGVSATALTGRSPAETSLEMARQFLSGRSRPLADLSAGEIGSSSVSPQVRGPLTAAVLTFVICLLVVAGSLLWRAQAYAGLVDRYDTEKQALFRKGFPGQPVPVGIVSRMQAAAGSRGDSTDGGKNAEPRPASALTLLYEVVSRLPPNVRVRFDDMQFDAGAILLHCTVRDHADADALATALRAGGRLLVDDPQTRQLSDGTIACTISAHEAVRRNGKELR